MRAIAALATLHLALGAFVARAPRPRARVVAQQGTQWERGAVADAPAASRGADALKDELFSLLLEPGPLSGAFSRQDEVNEVVLALSAVSPTPKPTGSNLLNGCWEVRYAGAPGSGLFDSPTRPLALALYMGGFSPGVLMQGLDKLPFQSSLDQTTVTITSPEAGQPRVTAEATVSALGQATAVKLRANLRAVTPVCLREDFVEVEAPLLPGPTLLPGPLAFSRSLFVVYLDDELLVVRDESGLPNVLTRKDKFVSDPSFADGAGKP